MSIPEILKKYKKVVVVGISANPDRPSHWIAKYLQDVGYEVVGINPGQPKVPGIKILKSISEVKGPLEIIDVFRSPDVIPALVEELKPFKPKVLWLQPGAENSEAEKTAEKYGMEVISGPCIYQEHQLLRGRK